MLAAIALKIRLANTVFNDRVAVVADEDVMAKETYTGDTAFLVEMFESAQPNQHSNAAVQIVSTQFAVIAAIRNDMALSDKLGTKAFNRIKDIRSDIFRAILGWYIPNEVFPVESVIYYVRGRLMSMNPAYLWYSYEFGVDHRIDSLTQGVDNGKEALDNFNEIYTQWIERNSLNYLQARNHANDLPFPAGNFDEDSLLSYQDYLPTGAFNNLEFTSDFDVYTGEQPV